MLALAACGTTEATPEPAQPVVVQSAGEAIAAVQEHLNDKQVFGGDGRVTCREWLLAGRWEATADGDTWAVARLSEIAAVPDSADDETQAERMRRVLRERFGDEASAPVEAKVSQAEYVVTNRWRLYPSGAVQTLDGVC